MTQQTIDILHFYIENTFEMSKYNVTRPGVDKVKPKAEKL